MTVGLAKLSLMIPTFQSGDTVERTLTSALAQQYRPLEVVVYDECSTDETRPIVERLLASAAPDTRARSDGVLIVWDLHRHRQLGTSTVNGLRLTSLTRSADGRIWFGHAATNLISVVEP